MTAPSTPEPIGLSRWQRRMAPLMAAAVVGVALFFAVVSVWQIVQIQAAMRPTETASLNEAWRTVTMAAPNYDRQFEQALARSAFELERDVIARRYHQAETAIAVRLWTRFMGFMTGMTLALVGGAFVLGKLSETTTVAEAKAISGLTLSLQSGSPGIILALLGTVLMVTAMSVPTTAETRDEPVYFAGRGASFVNSYPAETATSPAAPAVSAKTTDGTSATDAIIARAPEKLP